MEGAWVTIVGLLAVLQYMYFGLEVGRARGQYGINAPATTGHEMFDRVYRVHQNSLEQLVVFLPALAAFAAYVSALWGAVVGLVYIVGRFVYSAGYRADPEKRGTGMMITFLASAVLVLGGLGGAALASL
jgi:uncharacterized membrane protein YecN with MAPEG domain